MRKAAAILLLLLGACSSDPGPAPTPGPGRDAQAVDPHPDISAAEEARDPSSLLKAATWTDGRRRARAAVALGRILSPEGIEAVIALCRDENALVKRNAIFAAGQYGFDKAAASGREKELLAAVLPSMDDVEETVRVRSLQAAGKLGLEDTPALVVKYLQDPVMTVRAEAVMAAFRWRQAVRARDPQAKFPDLSADVFAGLRAGASDAESEVRWRVAYVFSRIVDPRAGVFLPKLVTDPGSPWIRLFAVQGLGRIKDPEHGPAVAAAQSDEELSVRAAAASALGAMGRADLVKEELLKDPSIHVRAAAAEALGADAKRGQDLLKALWRDDDSIQVRSAALAALVKLDPKGNRTEIFSAIANRHALIREAGVRAAATLGADGRSILEMAVADRDEMVRVAVLESLATAEGRTALEILKRGLVAKGITERATAVEALGKRKEDVVDDLANCWAASTERIYSEVREGIVDSLANQVPWKADPVLRQIAANDLSAAVRAKAIAVLKARGVAGLPESPLVPPTVSPYLGRRFAANPVVVIETNRGDFEVECFAKDAPNHVANFVGLVEKGLYDGLTWHRVVPNFVIQGGDPLGNGSGDAGWHLRAEINEVAYERGTLGMPRSQGWDTGGCQLFFTHVPTPHLNHLYTAFGRVVRGLEVVDRIERGDRIKKAYLKPPSGG